MSKKKFLKFSNPQNDSKELPNLEHSPCLHPTMWFINIITFHFLIAFRDLIWQYSKGRSKFDYMSLMILILPLIKEICSTLKRLFIGSPLVHYKKEKKRRTKKEKSHLKKKKKSFFSKIQFSWTTSWPDPLWQRYVGNLAEARSLSLKQPWRTKSK